MNWYHYSGAASSNLLFINTYNDMNYYWIRNNKSARYTYFSICTLCGISHYSYNYFSLQRYPSYSGQRDQSALFSWKVNKLWYYVQPLFSLTFHNAIIFACSANLNSELKETMNPFKVSINRGEKYHTSPFTIRIINATFQPQWFNVVPTSLNVIQDPWKL